DGVAGLSVVAPPHPIDRGDIGGAELPGPGRRLLDLGMLGAEPPACLQHTEPDMPARRCRERGGRIPPLRPALPARRHARDGGARDHRGWRSVHNRPHPISLDSAVPDGGRAMTEGGWDGKEGGERETGWGRPFGAEWARGV